ncbi:serpentine type 7TM GPCR chemoreceptor srh domain-containing protein [Ditylenchus destructor]|nr:serpentine type 7TM GPCR chemoreceptor srh domain-containing protein [Ditylenchus destructor]
MTALIIFLILFHTPRNMGLYKWYLMNMAISCYALDVFNDLLLLPVTIFPIIGVCTLGLLKPFNVYGTIIGWSCMQIFLGMCGTSLTYAVIYRTASLYDKQYILRKKSIIVMLIFIEVLYTSPAVIAGTLILPSHTKSVEYMSQNHPEMLEFFLTNSCMLLGLDIYSIMPFIIACMTMISLIVSVNVVAVIIASRGLKEARLKMTQKTYRMHKQLTRSVLFQWAIPTSMVTMSYVILIITCVMQLESAGTISYIAFVVSTFHTTVNGFIMIFTIRPYKAGVLKYLRKVMPFKIKTEEPVRVFSMSKHSWNVKPNASHGAIAVKPLQNRERVGFAQAKDMNRVPVAPMVRIYMETYSDLKRVFPNTSKKN